ncbi:MAG TPA: GNAT family N-acetyltransferase [Thermoplasmata archaeon]|nr:GNAT family N-acetyltransferase [Thermoplasmata archaeon]HLB67591.1 GNAT family N-acetyltransferase [Thermoplasmata archaeon]
MAKIKVRPLTEIDVPEIERIEKAITKSPRTSSLGRHVREQLKRGDAKACLVAEVDEKFAGFIVGDVRPWEFGTDRDVGWIKVVGVDPAAQGHGVGKALGDALLAYFKERRVERVRTLVEWHSGDMIAYFKTLGFNRSDLVTLERELP